MKAILLLTLLTGFFSFSQTAVDADIDAVESKVIEWRRHFHQNPERTCHLDLTFIFF